MTDYIFKQEGKLPLSDGILMVALFSEITNDLPEFDKLQSLIDEGKILVVHFPKGQYVAKWSAYANIEIKTANRITRKKEEISGSETVTEEEDEDAIIMGDPSLFTVNVDSFQYEQVKTYDMKVDMVDAKLEVIPVEDELAGEMNRLEM